MDYKKKTIISLILLIISFSLMIIVIVCKLPYANKIRYVLGFANIVLLIVIVRFIILWVFKGNNKQEQPLITNRVKTSVFIDATIGIEGKIQEIKKRKIKGVLTIKGCLELIGTSRVVNTGWTKYSLLQINNVLIKDVFVEEYLDSFLDLGVLQEFTFSRFFPMGRKILLLSIKVDGYVHKMPINKFVITLLSLFAILMLPLLPVLIFSGFLIYDYIDNPTISAIAPFLILLFLVSIKPIINYIRI